MIKGFSYVADPKSTVLILGSMPGIASLQENNYYAHPQNTFWWIMSHIIDKPLLELPFEQRYTLLKKHNIALWDVIDACEREGSLDAAINLKNFKANNFEQFFNKHQHIKKILCNGGLAFKLFKQLPAAKNFQVYQMPSTSPAYAAMAKQEKLMRWNAMFEDKTS